MDNFPVLTPAASESQAMPASEAVFFCVLNSFCMYCKTGNFLTVVIFFFPAIVRLLKPVFAITLQTAPMFDEDSGRTKTMIFSMSYDEFCVFQSQ